MKIAITGAGNIGTNNISLFGPRCPMALEEMTS